MRSATATDFQKNIGTWSKEAMTTPVSIERHGRPRLVLMSYEHYRSLVEPKGAEPVLEDIAEMEALDPGVMDSLRKLADEAATPSGIA